jgi:hypothetical protein
MTAWIEALTSSPTARTLKDRYNAMLSERDRLQVRVDELEYRTSLITDLEQTELICDRCPNTVVAICPAPSRAKALAHAERLGWFIDATAEIHVCRTCRSKAFRAS